MDKKLFLIDGHALIFKMYYAFLRHPMINSKGQDTSILFGFTKYLLELIEKEQPTHLAVSFDPPGGTFRHEMYPDYKGTRSETPQLVIDALEPLTEICQALRIPVLMMKGYEADDVIGTVAKQAEKEGFTVYMVTPDKDYGQLVSDHVLQYKPGKSGSDNEILGPADICSKYGISSPEQVIEMLTICGDTSDNVPGVKGVGEVGAGKLISRYGSVENIYRHLDELTAKQKAAFEAAREHIGMSHDLVTIRTDVPLQSDTSEMAIDFEYAPQIAELFDRYEFGSLKKHIGHISAPVTESTCKTLEIKEITAAEAVKIAGREGICAIVTSCDGDSIFSPVSSVTVGIAAPEGNFAAEGSVKDFISIISNGNITKTGYDLKRQCDILSNNGICLAGKLCDIELMHYLINPEKSHRIDILAKSYLEIDMEQSTAEPVSLSLFDEPETGYSKVSHTREAVVSCLLCKRIAEEMDALSMSRLYDEMEEPLIRVLSKMECSGIKVDLNQLRQYASSLNAELEQIQQRVRDMAGEPDLNVLSTKQIGHIIFEKLALDPKVKAKTGARYSYSTDEETLASLSDKHPIINEILEYRGVKKLLSTYIEPFPNYVSPQTGKIHTTFNQALTSTGRLSSSKPNLQNIPIRTERGKEIRKAFIPGTADGLILSADYSQIELRIMAHLSGDGHLIKAFRKNMDVHSITAAKIFGISPEDVTPDQRRIAKTANFGIMYGISAFGLSQRLKIARADAKRIIDDYFANFPSISSYIENTIASVRECGYAETLFGRRRYLPDINSRNASVRALAERNAINAPIQGTSADIIKKAMARVDTRIAGAGLKSRMVLQVHDELVFDTVPSEVETLKEIVVSEMENVITLSVPLTVECNYGKNWLEAH
ncbi:MAG: DNA polymerase I [Bacteroidales bacterium]|nr:DNA polymerase I [Bacteroidales bacterium]